MSAAFLAEVQAHPSAAAQLDHEVRDGDWALVVGVDLTNRSRVGHLLAALGYTAVVCDDGAAAQAEMAARRRPPAVVVADLEAPGAGGLAGAVGHHPEVTVVACGRRGRGSVRTCRVDVDVFLAKPFELAVAVAELRTALRRPAAQRLAIRRARRALRESYEWEASRGGRAGAARA